MPQGFRVVSYDISTLTAKTLMERKPVDLSLGSSHAYPGGIFLGTSLEFTQYYLGGTDDHDLILTFDFKEKDIIRGDLSPSSEVLVKEGVLVGARFEDESIQEKYGHLLDPSLCSSRRASMRAEPISESIGNRKVAVIRAMDSKSQHVHPMDYVYTTDQGAFYALAKRVLKAYEEGGAVRAGLEKSIKMALEHAVTTAIYEGEPQRVGFALLPSKDVFKAPNEGEFFYDGQKPARVETLFNVDENGLVSLVPKVREQVSEPSL